MSAHVRPDDAPLPLPGLGLPSPIHKALAALSRAADAACSRAAMGCSTAETLADLDGVDGLLSVAYVALGFGTPEPWLLFDAVEHRAREWAHACAVAETACDHYRRGGDGDTWTSAEAARFERHQALDAALRALGLCVSHSDTLRAALRPVDKSGGP